MLEISANAHLIHLQGQRGRTLYAARGSIDGDGIGGWQAGVMVQKQRSHFPT